MSDRETREQIARALLDIGAVSLSPDDPFTWSSGLRAPVYCDMRMTLGYPELRRLIISRFVEETSACEEAAEVIAGTATAGIPHAAWLADRMALPMVYVRSKPKGHGRQKQIEGILKPDATVVLVEDLVSTGGSALQAVQVLREEGARVRLVLAIFSYHLAVSERQFLDHDVQVVSLTDLPTLLDVAHAAGTINDEQRKQLEAWQQDPQGWSKSVKAGAGNLP